MPTGNDWKMCVKHYNAGSIVLLVVISSLLNISKECQAKTFEPCELAKVMVQKHRFPKEDIADWICLIRWESNYDTSAVGMLNSDGSKGHGLFQISDKYWCTEGELGGACGLDCKTLRDDDISDDSVCARRIYRVTKQRTGNGFSAWAAWTQRCQNQDKQAYIANCDIN